MIKNCILIGFGSWRAFHDQLLQLICKTVRQTLKSLQIDNNALVLFSSESRASAAVAAPASAPDAPAAPAAAAAAAAAAAVAAGAGTGFPALAASSMSSVQKSWLTTYLVRMGKI